MKNLMMFCMSMETNHLEAIKGFNYLPVGLGEKIFSEDWFVDNKGENISFKNKHYGEYTFHYWLWKNHLEKIEDGWIGFCQYRKFWSIEKKNLLPSSLSELKPLLLNNVPREYENFESILGDESFVNKFKLMKFVKKGFKLIARNPSVLLNSRRRNIRFHFDLMHGYKNLDKAINLLDEENRKDFHEFVSRKVSFNPHNMFICRSKIKLKKYYDSLFFWLEKCEHEFGNEQDRAYFKQYCNIDHFVYLSLTSGVKVGVTRYFNIPSYSLNKTISFK